MPGGAEPGPPAGALRWPAFRSSLACGVAHAQLRRAPPRSLNQPGPNEGPYRFCRDLTLLPKDQPFEPSQLRDHVMRPLSEPLNVFHAWLTWLGAI